jgi:hypothetical protein
MARFTALVWLEGTLADGSPNDIGRPIPGTQEALAALSLTHQVVILSSHARTIPGRKKVQLWLQSHAYAYAGIHDGPGVPVHDVRYDSAALLLDTPAGKNHITVTDATR